MIEVYNLNNAVTGATTLTFNNTVTETASTTLGNDNASIYLNAPGVYKVSFTGNVLVTASSGGNATVQMYVNNTPYSRAYASASTETQNTILNLSFSTLVPVKRTTADTVATLTFRYSNAVATINLADVVITKVA